MIGSSYSVGQSYGSFSADQIYSGLKATWSLALSSSPTTKLLTLTVPECAYKSAKLDGNRDTLNKFILEHVEERLYASLPIYT
ncbi:hypothetical protein EIK77_004507 [Talaromyces pinophilus]|nr:hypothetical protein EIK77_004507 [Talaromyces pinophilus]